MLRWVLRICGVVLAIVAGLIAMDVDQGIERIAPFHAADSFNLETASSTQDKAVLAHSLARIAQDRGVVLVKSSPDSDRPTTGRNYVSFGQDVTSRNSPRVEGDRIEWADPHLSGRVLSYQHMGEIPLSGMYDVDGSQAFRDAVEAWAHSMGVQIRWSPPFSLIDALLMMLTARGIGKALLAVVMLCVAAMVSWFFVASRGRALRLLGGASAPRIHREDTWRVCSQMGVGVIVGVIGMLMWSGIRGGIARVLAYAMPLLVSVGLVAIVLIVACVLISCVSRPNIRQIALRTTPVRVFSRVGMVVRFLTVMLVVWTIPQAVFTHSSLATSAQENALWSSMSNAVRVSVGGGERFETAEGSARFKEFLNRSQSAGIMRFSMAMDRAFSLDDITANAFDHVILTNWAFLKSQGVGADDLPATDFNKLPKPDALRKFFDGQMPLLTASKQPFPPGLTLHTYTGRGLLALGGDVGSPGSTLTAHHPLVIVVDDPATTLSVSGILVPALISGNLIFSDAEQLRTILGQTGLASSVNSIDKIAEINLLFAQALAREAATYVLAIVIAAAALILSAIEGAQLWSSVNQRRIFTLHAAGQRYARIGMPAMRSELLVVILAALSGVLIGLMLSPGAVSVATFVATVVAYAMTSSLTYQFALRKAFARVTHRTH